MLLVLLVFTLPALGSGRLVLRGGGVVAGVAAARVIGVGVFALLARATALDPVVGSVTYGLYAVLAAVSGVISWRERPRARSAAGTTAALLGSFLLAGSAASTTTL